MGGRKRSRSSRFRVGKVSGYLHHGAWWLYYREDSRPIRRKVALSRDDAEKLAAQINGQVAAGSPTLLSFSPIAVPELRRQFLDYHKLALKSSMGTVRRYRAATQHLEDSVNQQPKQPQTHQVRPGAFATYLRRIEVAPNGHKNTAKRKLRDKVKRATNHANRRLSMTRAQESPAVTRRAATAALGGGLLTVLCRPWCAWGQAKPLPSFSFVVLSDTHLGYQNQDSAAKQWAKTAQEIDAATGDFVLHLGDVVDGGREAQYAVYKETRKSIKKPVYEIPGNHDPQELFEKHIRKPVDLAFDHQGVRFLLINNSRTDSHDGFVNDKQLGWLGEQCADAAKKDLFLILCAHVPVHENKSPDRAWYVKPKDGQTDVYKLLDRHKDRVLALFHGHFHNGIRGWDDHAPLQEVVFPSALYNQDRKLADQKAPGFYLTEMRPGFVQVAIEKGQMKLQYKPIGVAESAEKTCPLPQLK